MEFCNQHCQKYLKNGDVPENQATEVSINCYKEVNPRNQTSNLEGELFDGFAMLMLAVLILKPPYPSRKPVSLN
jgi:hypothetical protein